LVLAVLVEHGRPPMLIQLLVELLRSGLFPHPHRPQLSKSAVAVAVVGSTPILRLLPHTSEGKTHQPTVVVVAHISICPFFRIRLVTTAMVTTAVLAGEMELVVAHAHLLLKRTAKDLGTATGHTVVAVPQAQSQRMLVP